MTIKQYLPVDIETTGLDFNKGRILGIGYGEVYNTNAKSIPPLPATCQNGRFEYKWLKKAGIPFNWHFDTLLAASILIDRPQDLDLGSLALHYIGAESWKSETNKLFKKKNWVELLEKSPDMQKALAERNRYDLKFTGELTNILQLKLKEEGLERFYFERLMPAAKMLADVEYRGMRIDLGAITHKLADINQKLVQLEKDLNIWAGTPINWNSPIQLKTLLKQKGYNLWTYNFSKRETVESTGVEVLERLLPNPKIQLLLDYREAQKLKSFLEGWLEDHHEGRLYPNYNLASTRTGRLSCIEENELIQVPGKQIPIKDIKVGDFVYCYDKNNKVTLKKVLRVIDNGMQNCVIVKWQSSGTGTIGHLICTEDHKIKTKYIGWQKAGNLKRYTKLVHLKRSLLPNGRQRLYGTNKFQELEEQTIKREYFKAENHLHIHHKNENRADNSIANLEILTHEQHAGHHQKIRKDLDLIKWKHLLNYEKKVLKGKDNPNYITVSKFTLLKKLAKAKGRLTYVDMDFETVKKKAIELNINLKEISKRYTIKGIYLNPATILKSFNKYQTVEQVAKNLGIGTRKLKEFCNLWGIAYNHMVLSVKSCGIKRVFDLEVEDCHNFIASEICVHNCSAPNLQQVPRDKSIRSLFIPSEGKKFVIADFAQIEPRVVAHYSQDEALLDVFKSGLDFYGSIACRVLGAPCSPNEVKSLYPDLRRTAKEIGLSVLYGIGAAKLSTLLTRRTGKAFSKDDAAQIIKDYFIAYPGLLSFRELVEKKVLNGEIIETFYGRRFKIDPAKVFSTGVNTIIQSVASDACLFSQLDINKKLDILGIDAPLIAIVHDEVIRECAPEHAETVGKLMEEVMTNQGFICPLKLDWAIGDSWGDKS